jgi:hypothetical protein
MSSRGMSYIGTSYKLQVTRTKCSGKLEVHVERRIWRGRAGEDELVVDEPDQW